MTYKKKSILRIVLIFSILIILATAGCSGIQNNLAQSEIKKLIVSYIEESMERRVSVDNVKDYSFNSITLSNFKIFEDDLLEKEENQIFQAEEIIVSYKFDLMAALKQKSALEIDSLTLIKPQMALVRDLDGHFDFLEKFNLIGKEMAFSINRINIEDGSLDYRDYQTTLEKGLLSKARSVNGYLSLGNLPVIELDISGVQEHKKTSLNLKGHFSISDTNYALDFVFKDAQLDHFQYYFAEAEIFRIQRGLFDLNLHLSDDSDVDQENFNWYGDAIAKDVDFSPDFLNNIKIDQADGYVSFDSKQATLSQITAFYKNSPFLLSGTLNYSKNFEYDIDVTSNECQLDDLKEEAGKYVNLSTDFSLNGQSEVSFKVIGFEEECQINGRLTAEKVSIEGHDFFQFSTRFDFADDTLRMSETETQIAGGIIRGNGEITLDMTSPKYSFLFDLEEVELNSPLLKPLVAGHLKSGTLSGNIGLNGIAINGESLNLKADLKLNNNEYGDFLFKTEGTIDQNNQLNLNLQTEGINLERLTKSFDYNEIKGQASFRGVLKGSLNNLKINGQIDVEKVKISDLPFDYLKGNIDYSDKLLTMEDFVLSNKDIYLAGDGQISYSPDAGHFAVDAVLNLSQTDLVFLEQLVQFDLPVSGLTSAEVVVRGKWPEIIAKGDFEFVNIHLGDYLAESGNAIVSLENNKINIENMMLKTGKHSIYAKGKLGLEKNIPLDLRVNFLNQDVQELLSNLVESELLEKFKGQATGSVEIKGFIDSPDIYIASIIEDVRLEGLPLNLVDLQIEKIGSLVQINRLKLKQQNGELNALGWIDLHPGKENMKIDMTANNIDLKQLSNFFNLDDMLEGSVSFTAKAEGNVNAPMVSFSAQVEKAKYAEFYFNELKLEALYDQEVLRINQFTLNKDGNQVIGKGEIPYHFSLANKDVDTPGFTDLPLNFTLNMENTDLNIIKLFFKDDFKQVGGLANLSLKLSGTLRDPLLNGAITLADGEMEFNQSIPKISHWNAMFRLEDNLLKITDMNFKIDQIAMNSSGEVLLKNLMPQDLRIKLWSNGQEIVYGDIFTGQTDFDIGITGQTSSPYIKGKAILSQGKLSLEETEETSFDMNKILEGLTDLDGDVDLKIEVKNDFILETKDFNLHLGGDITISGDLSAPVINGELGVEQGYIAFLDKRFRVSNGKIIFPNSLEKDLILNMKAKTRIDDIDILLHLGGSPSQLSITLESSPVLTENEIISLLMFNKNYAGLSEGELGQILQEEMVNLLAQGLSLTFLNQIENEVANSLGLDEFDIETIFKEEAGDDLEANQGLTLAGLALKIGKYFSENFYLTYSTPLYEGGKGNIEFEYKVKDDLILSTQMGSTGSQEEDFELKFELQYEF